MKLLAYYELGSCVTIYHSPTAHGGTISNHHFNMILGKWWRNDLEWPYFVMDGRLRVSTYRKMLYADWASLKELTYIKAR